MQQTLIAWERILWLTGTHLATEVGATSNYTEFHIKADGAWTRLGPRATGASTEWSYRFRPGALRGDLPGVASVRLPSSA